MSRTQATEVLAQLRRSHLSKDSLTLRQLVCQNVQLGKDVFKWLLKGVGWHQSMECATNTFEAFE
jgi:hypothetical protein